VYASVTATSIASVTHLRQRDSLEVKYTKIYHK
jgi:hypothetical protein